MAEAHDALICVGEKTFVDEANRKKYNFNHFLKNYAEIKNLFKDIPEALKNNQNFPKKFSFKPKKIKPKLPSLILNKDNTSEDELVLQAQNGLENRLENFIFLRNKNKNQNQIKKIYLDRLKHEINIINSMNYSVIFNCF